MFDSKFTKMGQDSLAEAARTAMQDGDLRRKAEAYVNESFGVYSRKAVVREQLAAYDAALEEAYRCVKEGKPLADKDYDKDGKIESPKDEVWGSRFRAAKKAGKMEEKKMWEGSGVSGEDPGMEVAKQAGARQQAQTPSSTPARTGNAAGATIAKAKDALNELTKSTEKATKAEVKSRLGKHTAPHLPEETVNEVAPPGREDQVKALKKKFPKKSSAYAVAWSSYNKSKKGLKEETISLEEANESFAAFVAEAINTFALTEHPEATVENLHMFNEAYVVACLDEAYACSEKKMKKHEKMKKDLEEAAEAFGKEKEEKGEKKHKEGKSEEAKEKAKKVLAKLKESRQINELSAFGSAFAAARKAGQSNFSYGGKSFNTKMASSPAAKTTSPIPTMGRTPEAAVSRTTSSPLPSMAASTPAAKAPAAPVGKRDFATTLGRDVGSGPEIKPDAPKPTVGKNDFASTLGRTGVGNDAPAAAPTPAPAPSTSSPPVEKGGSSNPPGAATGDVTPKAAPATSEPEVGRQKKDAGTPAASPTVAESVQVGANKYRIV
jgi:hypothetical protein